MLKEQTTDSTTAYREQDSNVSSEESVKTPLVDALRKYFYVEQVAKDIIATRVQNVSNMGLV